MGRVPVFVAWLALAGCASTPSPPRHVPRASLHIVEREVGPDLAALPRASQGVVELSLFIDAGARDASPPQVAAVAAQLAAERAGEGVRGRVWPEGSELTLRCQASEAAACVLRLSRGLATRAPSAAEVQRVLSRLADTRRAALAGDHAMAADRLALQAALGDAAAGLVPLGDARDDAAVDASRVGAFLAAHYGPRRALLVTAGDLSVAQLESAATHAFGRNPAAGAVRTARDALPAHDGVAVDVAERSELSLALVAPDLPSAASAASALRARLSRSRLVRSVTGHAFPLRGGAIALLRIDSGQAERALHVAAHDVAVMRIEGIEGDAGASGDDSLQALLHQAGLRWLTRDGGGARVQALALGAGALAMGGRADRTGEPDPDASERRRLQARMQEVLDGALAAARPQWSGDVDDAGGDVTLDNGARIAVRNRGSERVAIAIRFAGGAAAEPPLSHGRTALLATAAATACAGLGPGALQQRLDALGARLDARVQPDSWGLSLSAPAQHALAATRLAVECALEPWLSRRHVATARQRLRQRLGGPADAAELRARVAHALSPDAPGALAPWGHVDGIAGVSLDALSKLAARAQVGSNLAVAVIGPVEPEATIGLIARRLALLAEGAPALANPEAAGSPTVGPVVRPAAPPAEVLQPTSGILLWRAATPSPDAAGAQAFAALMRDGLSRIPGVQARWHDGGALADGGWAAVAVVADARTLETLRAGIDAAAAAIDRGRLADAATAAHLRAHTARASGGSRTATEAYARASALAAQPQQEDPASPAPDAAAARTLAVALANSRAHFHPLP